MHELDELVTATGKTDPRELTIQDLFIPSGSNLWQMVRSDHQLKEKLEA